jgi:hypothetical protein
MLYVIINIVNPWSNRWKNLGSWSGKTPFKNKFWELQVMKDDCLITIELVIRTRMDHGGFRTELGLLGHAVSFQIYDNRHWDYTRDKYDETA